VKPKNEIKLGVAILAAGKSERMGRPKLLLPWGTGTVLAHHLRVWGEVGGRLASKKAKKPAPGSESRLQPVPSDLRSSEFRDPIAQIGVVWSQNAPEIKKELDSIANKLVTAIENTNTTGEMWSSIQTVSRSSLWKPQLTHVCLALGDQPQICIETLTALVEAASCMGEGILQPEFQGKRGHPVIFSINWWRALGQSSGETLRDYLHAHAGVVKALTLHDPGLVEDIDAPRDVEAVLQRLSPR
jgi:molybdenum cofactor cytidylyltransferase